MNQSEWTKQTSGRQAWCLETRRPSHPEKDKKKIKVLQLASHQKEIGNDVRGEEERTVWRRRVVELGSCKIWQKIHVWFAPAISSPDQIRQSGFRFQSFWGGFGLWMKLSVQEVCHNWETFVKYPQVFLKFLSYTLYSCLLQFGILIFIFQCQIWKTYAFCIYVFSLTTHMRYCNLLKTDTSYERIVNFWTK